MLSGLCFYGVGTIQNFLKTFLQICFEFPYGGINVLEGSKKVKALAELFSWTAVTVLLVMGIAAVLVVLSGSLLRNCTRKKTLRLSIVSVVIMLFHVAFAVIDVLPAIPNYLLFSRLGWIDTHMPLMLPFLTGGAWFMFIGALLIFIGSIIQLFKTRKLVDEN